MQGEVISAEVYDYGLCHFMMNSAGLNAETPEPSTPHFSSFNSVIAVNAGEDTQTVAHILCRI